MPINATNPITIIPAQTSGGSLKNAALYIKQEGSRTFHVTKLANGGLEVDMKQIFGQVAKALGDAQSQLDGVANALRRPIPLNDPLQITDSSGNLIAQLGGIIDPNSNVGFSGIWASNLWVGGGGPSNAVISATSSGVAINGATFSLNLNGKTTSITNVNIAGVGIVGLEVQDNSTTDATVVSALGWGSYRTDPSNGLLTGGFGRNGNAGIFKVYNGTGAGGLGSGQEIVLDGSNGNLTINGVYVVGASAGIARGPENLGTSLTVNTDNTAVKGTPGAGQSNFTAVTSVTLNVTSHTFTGGILTA